MERGREREIKGKEGKGRGEEKRKREGEVLQNNEICTQKLTYFLSHPVELIATDGA